MRSMVCAVALLSVVLGVGCKKGPSLVGKWTGAVQGTPINVEFTPDGVMTTDTQRGPIDVLVTQSYQVHGDKANIVVKDVTIKGIPAGREALLDAFKRSQVGKGDTETIKFVSDDQVTLTGKMAITLSRVRE